MTTALRPILTPAERARLPKPHPCETTGCEGMARPHLVLCDGCIEELLGIRKREGDR